MPKVIEVDKLFGVTVHFLYRTRISIHHHAGNCTARGVSCRCRDSFVGQARLECPEAVQMIDSTIIRAHHQAAGAKGGLKNKALAAQKVAL